MHSCTIDRRVKSEYTCCSSYPEQAAEGKDVQECVEILVQRLLVSATVPLFDRKLSVKERNRNLVLPLTVLQGELQLSSIPRQHSTMLQLHRF